MIVWCSLVTSSRPLTCPFSAASQLQDGRWKPFLVKPLPSQLMKPLLVFVNPKSGGNQVIIVPTYKYSPPQMCVCTACDRRPTLLLLNSIKNTHDDDSCFIIKYSTLK